MFTGFALLLLFKGVEVGEEPAASIPNGVSRKNKIPLVLFVQHAPRFREWGKDNQDPN